MATTAEIDHIRRVVGEMYAGEIDADTAERKIAGVVRKESLAEFILDAFNRGWITRGNLGLDEDGKII